MILIVAWLAIAVVLAGVLVWRLRPSLRRPEKRPIGLRFALIGSAFYGVMAPVFALNGEWLLAAGHLLLFAMLVRYAVIARRRRPARSM